MRHDKTSEITSLYRCYYYKSISLREPGQDEECLALLKEDLQYEESHGEDADAEKTRSEIVRTCMDLNRIKEASRYVTPVTREAFLSAKMSRE